MTHKELYCLWNFVKFFSDVRDERFKGYGHTFKYFKDPLTGLVFKGKKGSTIHFIHWFLATDGTIRMRWKTSATLGEWLPKGADGVRAIGYQVFKVMPHQLPRLNCAPEFEEFNEEWKDLQQKDTYLKTMKRVRSLLKPIQK